MLHAPLEPQYKVPRSRAAGYKLRDKTFSLFMGDEGFMDNE